MRHRAVTAEVCVQHPRRWQALALAELADVAKCTAVVSVWAYSVELLAPSVA
jgi:hypothetical protein